MNERIKQRICLKFCYENGILFTDSHRMLQKAYGESAISKTRVGNWYAAFREGREILEDLPRRKRPSTSLNDENIDKVKKIVLEEPQSSVGKIAGDLNISRETVCMILAENLSIDYFGERLVPKELNFLQKNDRKEFAADILNHAKSDALFMQQIITGGETWFYEYNMPTTQQSSEDEPKAKMPCLGRSKGKVLLTVFFDIHGLVHFEFLPEKHKINKEYNLGVMERLRENVRRKRPHLFEDNAWILYHDNPIAYVSSLVREFLTKNSTHVIDNAPYSPDLFPCDFFLFPEIRRLLHGKRFESIHELKSNLQRDMKSIPSSEYKKCMEEWIKRLTKCIASDGDYYESEEINAEE